MKLKQQLANTNELLKATKDLQLKYSELIKSTNDLLIKLNQSNYERNIKHEKY
jgi:hypothetical protein